MLDKTIDVKKIAKGTIHRADGMSMVAGGKGINVSRQLRKLGVDSLATGFLGGETGAIVRRLLDEEGITHDFVATNALTREGLTFREQDGTSTAVFEPSLRTDANCAEELKNKLRVLSRKSSWFVCSGSSPGNEVDGLFREVLGIAQQAGVMGVLDSYGRAFEAGLTACPSLVKPNKHEFEQTFGVRIETEPEFLEALNHLLGKGIQYCIISNGPLPCYAALRGHYWRVIPPKIPTVNAIGSGDAMIAGILYGFSQGWKFQRSLTFGIAAGAANASTWKVASSSLQEIAALEQEVAIQRIG